MEKSLVKWAPGHLHISSPKVYNFSHQRHNALHGSFHSVTELYFIGHIVYNYLIFLLASFVHIFCSNEGMLTNKYQSLQLVWISFVPTQTQCININQHSQLSIIFILEPLIFFGILHINTYYRRLGYMSGPASLGAIFCGHDLQI